MDKGKTGTAEVGEEESCQALSMLLHQGRESIGNVDVSLDQGDFASMVRSEWSAIGRVGLSHHGPSYSSPGCESEKVLLGESDPDCYDAGEYDLSLSNDRRCHREAVQGCYVRSMGRVDGELWHGNDFCM